MIRSSVTLSLVEQARGGPFVFWHDLNHACNTAAQLGFDAIEIFAPGPEPFQSPDLPHQLSGNNLALAAVGTGAGWVIHKLSLSDPNPANRSRAVDFVKSMIDAGAPFHAPAIIGSMQGTITNPADKPTALAHLADSLNQLASHAAQSGVPLLFEPLNRYETKLINTLQSATDLITTLSHQNVKILADLFHMNIEEPCIATSIFSAGQHIGHVHFVDSNRNPAGNGHIPFEPIAQALNQINYSGYLSAECFPYPNSDTAAATTIQSFNKFFR